MLQHQNAYPTGAGQIGTPTPRSIDVSVRPGDVTLGLNAVADAICELEQRLTDLEQKLLRVCYDSDLAEAKPQPAQPEPNRSDLGTAIFDLNRRLRSLNQRAGTLHRTLQL